MSQKDTHFIGNAALAAVLAAIASLSSSLVSPTAADAGSADALACEIVSSRRDGALIIEGSAVAPFSGPSSYRLTVSGSGRAGSADIEQSGEVALRRGEPAMLGSVVLGNNGGTVSARLEVSSRGAHATCRKRFDLRDL